MTTATSGRWVRSRPAAAGASSAAPAPTRFETASSAPPSRTGTPASASSVGSQAAIE
jgi:hypothetical protein